MEMVDRSKEKLIRWRQKEGTERNADHIEVCYFSTLDSAMKENIREQWPADIYTADWLLHNHGRFYTKDFTRIVRTEII